jgi:tetratricopeptide (TPR) repeat protein
MSGKGFFPRVVSASRGPPFESIAHALRGVCGQMLQPAKRDTLIAKGAGPDSIEAAKVLMTSAPDMEGMPRGFGKQQGYRILSELYLNLGMKQEAVETSKQALEVFGDEATLRYQLGHIYLAVGDKESAMAQYKILKERADKAQDKDTKRLYEGWADGLWKELNK